MDKFEELPLKEAIIPALLFGCFEVDGERRYYSSLAISEFLGVTKDEVESVRQNGLEQFRNGFNEFFDRAVSYNDSDEVNKVVGVVKSKEKRIEKNVVRK